MIHPFRVARAASAATMLVYAIVCVPAAAQGVRDSAGIRIVANDRPVWTPAQAFRLAASPALTIGEQDGERYEFNRVAGTVRLTDGTIVVANGGSFELRFYDSTGAYLKATGRRGQGPGEFTSIASLSKLPGDTLAVFDQRIAIRVFSPGGTYVRSISSMAPPIPGPPGPKVVMALFPGDSRVIVTAGPPGQRARGARWVEHAPFFFVDAQNVPTHRLGDLPFMEFVMEDYARPMWFAPEGTFTSDTRHFYYGFSGEYSITVYTSDGRPARIIRRRWTPAKVTAAGIEKYQVEWGKRWIKSTGAQAEKQRAELRDDPYASTVPAFSQFIVDAAGRLWVREPHVGDAAWAGSLGGLPLEPSTWNVFDAEGRWLCDIVTPARFLLKEIGRNYVLGVARGEDDLETVALYRLNGGRPAR